MKREKWLLAIGGAWLTSTSLCLASWYNEGIQITEHNDNARKQVVLPLVKEHYAAKVEDITVSLIESETNCQRTDYSEPVNVFLEQKLIGRYCLNKSIDKDIKKGVWEETPLPYKYHSAKKL